MTKVKEEEPWKITTKRYVAFIDIMGFKDLVSKSTHDEIYEMMKAIDKSKKHMEGVKWSDLQENLVTSTTYSDSIIVYSKDDSYEALDVLVSTVAGLMHYLFLDGIPFKGAVAFGNMTLDKKNSIFFGQPLIDAYLLQEEINFYGTLFHATVDYQLDLNGDKWPLFTTHHVCPLKAGNARHMTIYPMYALQKNDKKYGGDYVKFTESIKKLRLKTSGRLRKYIDSTEDYLKTITRPAKRNYD